MRKLARQQKKPTLGSKVRFIASTVLVNWSSGRSRARSPQQQTPAVRHTHALLVLDGM